MFVGSFNLLKYEIVLTYPLSGRSVNWYRSIKQHWRSWHQLPRMFTSLETHPLLWNQLFNNWNVSFWQPYLWLKPDCIMPKLQTSFHYIHTNTLSHTQNSHQSSEHCCTFFIPLWCDITMNSVLTVDTILVRMFLKQYNVSN